MKVTGALSRNGDLSVTAVGYRGQDPAAVAAVFARVVADVLNAGPIVAPAGPGEVPAPPAAPPEPRNPRRRTPRSPAARPSAPEPPPALVDALVDAQQARPAAAAEPTPAPEPRVPQQPAAAPPSPAPAGPPLVEQLCELVDEQGLRLEQAAARLGISRAKARKLYAGEDVA